MPNSKRTMPFPTHPISSILLSVTLGASPLCPMRKANCKHLTFPMYYSQRLHTKVPLYVWIPNFIAIWKPMWTLPKLKTKGVAWPISSIWPLATWCTDLEGVTNIFFLFSIFLTKGKVTQIYLQVFNSQKRSSKQVINNKKKCLSCCWKPALSSGSNGSVLTRVLLPTIWQIKSPKLQNGSRQKIM